MEEMWYNIRKSAEKRNVTGPLVFLATTEKGMKPWVSTKVHLR